MRKNFILGISLLVVTGCAGRNFNTDMVKDIKNGVTTRAEIMEWFGKPYQQQRTTFNGKPVLQYTYLYAKSGPFGAGYSSKSLTVDFDEQDVVTSNSLYESGGTVRD